jgi:hypothetical protein
MWKRGASATVGRVGPGDPSEPRPSVCGVQLALRAEPFTTRVVDAGDPVTGERIWAELARHLGFGPDAAPVVPSKGLSVRLGIAEAGREIVVTLSVETDGADDFAEFERGMAALIQTRRSLSLAASDAAPGWSHIVSVYGREKEQFVRHPIDGLLGTDLDCADALEVTLQVPRRLLDSLGPEPYANVALTANTAPSYLSGRRPELSFRVDRRESTVTIAAEPARFGKLEVSDFTRIVRAFFDEHLPERLPQRAARLARVTGVATPIAPAERERPRALPIAAALLTALALASWLVPVDTAWLVLGCVWWGAAVAVPVVQTRAVRRSLASVAGIASTFLGLMVGFGLIYGAIYAAGGAIELPWLQATHTPRLGEMLMLSLGVAVSAGTTDVTIEGVARFVAFVEMLFFFGTVAAVIGALGRRWLFDREIRISGEAPVTGLDDGDAAR